MIFMMGNRLDSGWRMDSFPGKKFIPEKKRRCDGIL